MSLGIRNWWGVVALLWVIGSASGQTFEVATIRPSGGEVKYERNGRTDFVSGTLRMRDVTVSSCIQLAYGVSDGLVTGPAALKATHYDVMAKAETGTSQAQMRVMLQELLRDRFSLRFHREKKEMRVYSLVVAKGGMKMRPAVAGVEMSRTNRASGMVARSISMGELATYLADPLGAPLTDGTGLAGRYDLAIDFTKYVDMREDELRADPAAVLKAALRGELGLELVQRREVVELIVVDKLAAPTAN